MNKFLCEVLKATFILHLLSPNLIGQITPTGTGPTPPQIKDTVYYDLGCFCDVLIEVNDPTPPGTISTFYGNLDEFEKTTHGVCERSVNVNLRRNSISTNQVNNVNELIQCFGESDNELCFKGKFEFTDSIAIGYGTRIVLLPGTIFEYKGDGNEPAIIFEGNNGTLTGHNRGEPGIIKTDVPMNKGLIGIYSKDEKHKFENDPDNGRINNRNKLKNRIKNLNLISTSTSDPNDPTGKNDRAIVMENLTESIVQLKGSGDRGGNLYFTHITDLIVDGFGLGIHMRGEANGNNIRDITFRNIDNYGFWITGCADNSITNIQFENSEEAVAIRFDNHIKDEFNGIQFANSTTIAEVPDPNFRKEIRCSDILVPLINDSSNQNEFNDKLIDLNVHLYDILVRSNCNTSFNNVPTPGFLSQFGLKGYALDEVPLTYLNFSPDGLDITGIVYDPNDPNFTDPDFLNLYKDYTKTSMPPTLTKTCDNDIIHTTRFYVRPRFNVISQLNIYNENEEIQVNSALEVADREDDLDYCEFENISNSGACNSCDLGLFNRVYLCNTGTDNIQTLLKNESIKGNGKCPSIINQNSVEVINENVSQPAFILSFH